MFFLISGLKINTKGSSEFWRRVFSRHIKATAILHLFAKNSL